jgi:BirA family biotin operon repressor/biotin-[acetyl-CoA-carboxylase] ligase
LNPSSLPADVAEALAQARPRLGRLATSVVYFPITGSTNDVAAALVRNAGVADHEGAVVLADAQTAGRGRRGREWFSPPGSGLYVSLVLMPGRSRVDGARATALLTLAAGVALAEGVEKATGLRVDVKWPNDLYVSGRKFAGILAESVSSPGDRPPIVLGYGINVGPMAYPPDLRDRATSLESELGRPMDRAQVFVETLAALARRYDDLLAGRFDAILDAWRAKAPASTGARVAWTTASGTREGVTAGVDDRGALLVRIDDRTERIIAGELTWRT